MRETLIKDQGLGVDFVSSAGFANLRYHNGSLQVFDGEWKNITEPSAFTIKFVNWDNAVLQESQVAKGETPVYTGSTPERPQETTDDGITTYSFAGWDKTIVAATEDTTYTATYSSEFTPSVRKPKVSLMTCAKATNANATLMVDTNSSEYTTLTFCYYVDEDGNDLSVKAGSTNLKISGVTITLRAIRTIYYGNSFYFEFSNSDGDTVLVLGADKVSC